MTPVQTCEWYAEIGSGVCDECGRPAREHRGARTLRRGASPFGVDEDAWENVTWAELRERADHEERVRAARRLLAELDDRQAVALADAVGRLRLNEGT